MVDLLIRIATRSAQGVLILGISFEAGWWIISPLLMAALGVPPGLGEDYTTWEMVLYGLSAQCLPLALLVFLLFRFWIRGNKGTVTRVDSYAALNPITVFVGFWGVAMLAPEAADTHLGLAYFRLPNAIIWALASIVLGVWWSRRRGSRQS